MVSQRRGQLGQPSPQGDADQEREAHVRRAEREALQLLSQRDYAEEELRRKLRAAFYEDDHIDVVFVRFRAYRYLDDVRVAELGVRALMAAGWGPAQIRRKLTERGLAVSLIASTIAAETRSEGEDIWLRRARDRVRGDFRCAPEALSSRLRPRVYRHLIYCGYPRRVAAVVALDPR